MIKTIDNTFVENEGAGINCSASAKKYISNYLEISIGDYLKHNNNKIFHLPQSNTDESRADLSDLVISIKKNADTSTYQIQTGNYVGKFFWGEIEIDVGSRFPEDFLKRMLHFANDIFLDDLENNANNSKTKNQSITQFILYYLFTQSLEKAYLIGFPKSYRTQKNHGLALKGRIDIPSFLNKDIPFKGRISSIVSEQKEAQEIIDVIHKAIEIVNSSGFSTRHISNIKLHLNEAHSKKAVTNSTVQKALNSKPLQNPIYASYKKVLEYAKTIINSHEMHIHSEANEKFHGFIINVAELFEIYITKLLRKEFKSWDVESPKHQLYGTNFFKRKIIPDIVMTQANKVIVFDTKYKRMRMLESNRFGMGDLDREDFFQINTYMSYYQNQNFDVLAGGLIYPMEQFDQKRCYADEWLGKPGSKFIVDGIDFSKLEANKFHDVEKSFIDRVNQIINPL